MKRITLLPLAGGALLTATALYLAFHATSPVGAQSSPAARYPRQNIFGCTSGYVPATGDDIPPLTGWGSFRWKVTTTSDSAQYYFNQGMAMYYAFHIVEARASFEKAARFDTAFAMAWWGKALAFGPNINDFGYQPPSEAFSSAQKAVQLKARCTPAEKALIDAIAVRYSADTTIKQNLLNEKYAEAMRQAVEQFPKSAELVVLYADALLILHPWDLYNHDFSPKPWTPKTVAAIRAALRLAPRHPGANHYLIHAVEGSARPDDALQSAAILAAAMPNVAHMTHMPSHIYIRTGYYQKGMELNTQAVQGFKKYAGVFAPVSEGQILYSLHNLHMKMACAHMAGNYAESLAAARELQQQVPADYLTLSNAMGHYLQYLYQSPLFTHLRFGKWREALQERLGNGLPYAKVLQHFGHGMAYARLGRIAEAANEAALLAEAMQPEGLKEPFSPFNSAYDGAVIARHILEGSLAMVRKQPDKAVEHFRQAVNAEDKLIYNEPRDWLLPARHYLSDALLRAGRHAEALVVLQKDLQINPANGWALSGLQLAFKQLRRTAAVQATTHRLRNAWRMKDVSITRPAF